jgi:hypothetical protein
MVGLEQRFALSSEIVVGRGEAGEDASHLADLRAPEGGKAGAPRMPLLPV